VSVGRWMVVVDEPDGAGETPPLGEVGVDDEVLLLLVVVVVVVWLVVVVVSARCL
jgi:hypothetical protein